MKKKAKTVFVCGYCEEEFSSFYEAERCELDHVDLKGKLKIGARLEIGNEGGTYFSADVIGFKRDGGEVLIVLKRDEDIHTRSINNVRIPRENKQ